VHWRYSSAVIPLLAVFIIKNTTKKRERERSKLWTKSLRKFIKIKFPTKTTYSVLTYKRNNSQSITDHIFLSVVLPLLFFPWYMGVSMWNLVFLTDFGHGKVACSNTIFFNCFSVKSCSSFVSLKMSYVRDFVLTSHTIFMLADWILAYRVCQSVLRAIAFAFSYCIHIQNDNTTPLRKSPLSCWYVFFMFKKFCL